MHWLLAEWTNSAAALAKSLAQQGVNKELATIIGDTYSSGVVEWSAALHDEVAKQAIKTLFVCFRRPGYPYGTTDYAETEPKKWDKNPDVARAATEMLRLHTLLRMGASSCNTEFHAAPLRERHALLKSTRTTYVWGGGEMMAEKMAEDYQGLLSLSDRTSAECFVIVLMKPRNQTDPDELEKHLFDRIDQASAPADGGPHLKEGQGVTRGEAWRPIFLYDHEIEDALSQREPSAAQRQLSAAVQGVLERAARN